MKKSFLLMLLASVCMLGSCSKLSQAQNLRSDELAPLVPIELTAAEQSVRDASNAFGLNTFSRLYTAGGQKEVAFSPLSLSLALSMVASGAEGDTWQQFAQVIGWGEASRDEVGGYYQKMVEGLVKADTNVEFTSANSFWAAKDLTLKPDFLSRLKQYFAAEGYSVNFSDPATLGQINQWCSDKTDGKIPNMLSDLDSDTRLMLINALLFKAPWRLTWQVKQNRDFNAAGGATVKKDYLYTAEQDLTYGDFGDFELVRVPYGNGAYLMDVILPKAGKSLSEILPKLNSDDINYGLKSAKVTLYLPKWSMDYSTEDYLIPVLQAQGLTLPFSGLANFSGISPESLYINQVLQKVRIDVNEKGTEFAAVTVIGMLKTTALPITPPSVTVDVNRPFAYTIRESTSGTILLLGTLSK